MSDEWRTELMYGALEGGDDAYLAKCIEEDICLEIFADVVFVVCTSKLKNKTLAEKLLNFHTLDKSSPDYQSAVTKTFQFMAVVQNRPDQEILDLVFDAIKNDQTSKDRVLCRIFAAAAPKVALAKRLVAHGADLEKAKQSAEEELQSLKKEAEDTYKRFEANTKKVKDFTADVLKI